MGEVQLKQVNVSKFLEQYDSKTTRANYRVGLKQFFRLMYPYSRDDLDSLSERYLREDRDFREDMLKLKASLEGKAPMTKIARFNAIRVFLDENGTTLPKRLFRKLNGRVTEPITYEEIPTNEQLKRICDYLSIQGKAFTLMLTSSGMRVGEAVKLELDDIDFKFRYKVGKEDLTLCKIRIRADITKTGKRRITFITPEAQEAVEEWLNFRAQYLKQAKGRTSVVKRGSRKKSDKLLFPFTTSNFNAMWRNALEKAKLAVIDKKTNRIQMRPHNLRKYFRLRVGRFGVDEAEALMGHQQGLNKVYARFEGQAGEQRLAEIYVKAIKELSIFEYAVKENTIQFEIVQENRRLEQSVRLLREKNDSIWKRVESLNRDVNELKGDFVKMFQLIQEEEDFSDVLRKYVKW